MVEDLLTPIYYFGNTAVPVRFQEVKDVKYLIFKDVLGAKKRFLWVDLENKQRGWSRDSINTPECGATLSLREIEFCETLLKGVQNA